MVIPINFDIRNSGRWWDGNLCAPDQAARRRRRCSTKNTNNGSHYKVDDPNIIAVLCVTQGSSLFTPVMFFEVQEALCIHCSKPTLFLSTPRALKGSQKSFVCCYCADHIPPCVFQDFYKVLCSLLSVFSRYKGFFEPCTLSRTMLPRIVRTSLTSFLLELLSTNLLHKLTFPLALKFQFSNLQQFRKARDHNTSPQKTQTKHRPKTKS